MTIDVIAAARSRTRRRAGLAVLAFAAVATLTGAAVRYLAAGHDGDRPTTVPVDHATTAAADAQAMPADLRWVQVTGVWLPTSPATGPQRLNGTISAGFAHTPAGAVVAALHLLVRTSPQAGPDVFEPALGSQIAGADADVLREQVAQDYRRLAAAAGVRLGDPIGPLPAAIAGYTVDTYTAQHVRLQILTSVTDPARGTVFAATAVEMTWTGQDWALIAPPAGRWDSVVQLVPPARVDDYRPLAPGR